MALFSVGAWKEWCLCLAAFFSVLSHCSSRSARLDGSETTQRYAPRNPWRGRSSLVDRRASGGVSRETAPLSRRLREHASASTGARERGDSRSVQPIASMATSWRQVDGVDESTQSHGARLIRLCQSVAATAQKAIVRSDQRRPAGGGSSAAEERGRWRTVEVEDPVQERVEERPNCH